MSYTGIIKIPVLFDMSGDTIVYGEDVTGDFVTSHLDFILDMTAEANDISLNAADISAAILVGDQDNTDNLFYSGGTDSTAIDNLCNRISKAITRGKLVHIPKAGNHSNSGIPLGGRAELVDATGTHTIYHIQNVHTPKYFTTVAPIGDEQMLGEAMARVASIHLVGTPLAAAAFDDAASIQTSLETASAQTFNSGNTAFYNALAVQLSKVLGGSKSSAPMKAGVIIQGTPITISYEENFEDDAYVGVANYDDAPIQSVTGHLGTTTKALYRSGTAELGRWRQDRATHLSVKTFSFWFKYDGGSQNLRSIFVVSPGTNVFGDDTWHIYSDQNGGLLSKSTSRLVNGAYHANNTLGAKVYLNGVEYDEGSNKLFMQDHGTEWQSSRPYIGNQDNGWAHIVLTIAGDRSTLPVGNYNPGILFGENAYNGQTSSPVGMYWAKGWFDDVQYWDIELNASQIAELYAGNNPAGAIEIPRPLDASGVSVPALKSIYEQLMSVPGRSQIMQTRDISGVVDNSNTTLTGGFPFISGDKLVMYLRPKIVFDAQTVAEQSTSLVGFSDGVTLNTPSFNVGRDGQGITGQAYTQSDYYDNQASYKGEKAFDGTITGGYGWLANDPFDNTTGAYNANPPNNTSVDGVNLSGSWVQVNIGKKVAVTSYKIYPQDWEKPSIGGRSPHIFKLVYSDNGTNFLTADSQTVGTSNTDTSKWATTNDGNATYIPKTFTLTQTKIGQYWRLIVTSVYGNSLSNGGALAVQELEINGSDDYSGSGDSGGVDLSGLQTNIVATAENIEDAFPGNATTGPEPEMNKWGWMGSPNSDSLTLESTDVTDIRTIDLHIWKITITL